MLKKTRVLFLGLVVLAGSACVTPTHASSADSVIITHIQAGGALGAKEEFIILYNTSPLDIDITDWCLANKSAIKFACFARDGQPGYFIDYKVRGYGYLSIASEEYVTRQAIHRDFYSNIFTVTNQSSGSLVGSADSVSIVNDQDEIVSNTTWTTPLAAGKSLSRILFTTNPDIYATTNNSADWLFTSDIPFPKNDILRQFHEIGEEPNIPEPPITPRQILITELLPNPNGTDTGNEFIEFYNPSETESVSLEGLRLRLGYETPKWYTLPAITVESLGYALLSNQDINFSLANTVGRLELYDGEMSVGQVVEYTSPKDGQSWGLFGEEWRYTTTPTPGAANQLPSLENTNTDEEDTQKPCASNQYRNPETGRCKLVATTSTAPAACKVGQERNSETNRCRNVAGASTSPTPCKEGQERNPETNRCRNIVKMSKAGHPVDDVKEGASNQPNWYYWLALGGLVLAVLGYGVWEWRGELGALWIRAKALLGR